MLRAIYFELVEDAIQSKKSKIDQDSDFFDYLDRSFIFKCFPGVEVIWFKGIMSCFKLVFFAICVLLSLIIFTGELTIFLHKDFVA
jgi:hypothetical protein